MRCSHVCFEEASTPLKEATDARDVVPKACAPTAWNSHVEHGTVSEPVDSGDGGKSLPEGNPVQGGPTQQV